MTDRIVKRDPKTRRVGMETKKLPLLQPGGTVANALREAFEAEARSATNVEREQRAKATNACSRSYRVPPRRFTGCR